MITRKIPETCSSFESAQKVSELTLLNVSAWKRGFFAHYTTADKKKPRQIIKSQLQRDGYTLFLEIKFATKLPNVAG